MPLLILSNRSESPIQLSEGDGLHPKPFLSSLSSPLSHHVQAPTSRTHRQGSSSPCSSLYQQPTREATLHLVQQGLRSSNTISATGSGTRCCRSAAAVALLCKDPSSSWDLLVQVKQNP